MARLQGKVAFITGGASGIGAACARAFAREGAHVVLTDVQNGSAVAEEIGALFLPHDVADPAQWDAAMMQTLDAHDRLDVMVNNAGVFAQGSIEEVTLEQWHRVLAVNLTGVMLGCQHAVRAMRADPGGPSGAIVNVSSITGFIGLANGAAYTASKGAVRLLTKSVAVHCARQYRRIRCNSLHPGAIDTPMNQAAFDASGDPKGMRAMFAGLQPIGRLASAEEMAEAALFLGSDASSYVTGAELVADGGWLAASGPL